MGLSGHDVPVFEGQTSLFLENKEPSDGVSFLISEAFSGNEKPLFVICQGALTNLACALRQEPSLSARLTAIVIGGINYPNGGFEFNTMNDIDAFNYVMKSDLPIRVIPEEVYSTLQVSFFEIWERVAPCGAVGSYLSDSMIEANRRLSSRIPMLPSQSREDYALSFPSGESWALGDSAGIGLLLTSNSGKWHLANPPFVHPNGSYQIMEDCRPIRWYDSIDTRFILEDFFAKLKYYYGEM